MKKAAAVEMLCAGREGIEEWNAYRARGEPIPDLSDVDFRLQAAKSRSLEGADLHEASLKRVQMSNVNLSRSNLRGALLIEANLYRGILDDADLTDANLIDAELHTASLRNATLDHSAFQGADLTQADLTGASIRNVNLEGAKLIRTNLSRARLDRCSVYGAAVWDVDLGEARQSDLILAPFGRAVLWVDDLEIAGLLYLLLRNSKFREVINAISSKVVLLLGRFTAERKEILASLRSHLTRAGYCPVIFDWQPPQTRDLTETVQTLALLSRFVVVDLSDPRSTPHELASIVPHLRSIPIAPVIRANEAPYGMFADLTRYPWVLEATLYDESSGFSEEEFSALLTRVRDALKE